MGLTYKLLDGVLSKIENSAKKISESTSQSTDRMTTYARAIETSLSASNDTDALKEFEVLKQSHIQLAENTIGTKILSEDNNPNILAMGKYAKKHKKITERIISDYEAFAKKYGINLS